MGSCMANLNCLPPRAAAVNYWFFLLAHLVVRVGIKQNVKCEMLLRKIDGKMNVQNCGFSAKKKQNCEMETVATCSVTDGNDSYHGLAPSFFEEMTRCRRQKHCRRRPDNPKTLMVHQNSANITSTFRFYVCLRLRDWNCCSAADGNGSCHAPAPSYFEEMTRCRRQKLHWRWPGNPNGRSKFRNLGLFTFTRS